MADISLWIPQEIIPVFLKYHSQIQGLSIMKALDFLIPLYPIMIENHTENIVVLRGFNARTHHSETVMTVGAFLRVMQARIMTHPVFRGYKVDDLVQFTLDHPQVTSIPDESCGG
jgi:hypothetical protein